MRISSFTVVLAALLLVGSEAQPWPWPRGGSTFPRFGRDCSKSSSPVKCTQNSDCTTACRSTEYECIGCPNCPGSNKIDGHCFLKGTHAVRCQAPSSNNPGCKPHNPPPNQCTRQKKCRSDRECKRCGADFECKKCPPNGCPGRDVGTCLPKSELIACTLELCINPTPTPNPTPKPTPKPKPTPPSSVCKRGGCSSQLCIDPSKSPGFSTCEFRPEFECYKNAECGNFGRGGECAFKQTSQLKLCLLQKRKKPVSFGPASISG